MTNTVETLILDLVEWVELRERTYQETMDAWRTSCPRLPVWEDANERGLVGRMMVNGRVMVRATPDGLALLKERRPGYLRGPAPLELSSASAMTTREPTTGDVRR